MASPRCGKNICECKVLSVILSHFRPTGCHARGGACGSHGGLARGVAVTVTGAVQGQCLSGCSASMAVAADARPCFTNLEMRAATGAAAAVTPTSSTIARPTTVSRVGVPSVSSVPMLVVGAVHQEHRGHSQLAAANARACLSKFKSTAPRLSIVLATIAAPFSSTRKMPTTVTPVRVCYVSSVQVPCVLCIGAALSAASEED